MKAKWSCHTPLALLLSVACGTVGANVITSGCTLDPNVACSLAELVNDPNAYIQIDGARFRNFGQFGIPDIDLSRIRVQAVDSVGDGNQNLNVVGLTFTPFGGLTSLLEAFSSSSFNVSRDIFYDVSILSGLWIGASDLSARFGDFRNSGGIFIDGGALASGAFEMSALCSQYSNIPPDFSCEGMTAFSNATIGPRPAISENDQLFIDYEHFTGQRLDGMQILQFQHVYTRLVPEPTTLALLGLSLAGLSLTRRRIQPH